MTRAQATDERESGVDLLHGRRADDDGDALLVRRVDRLEVGDVVEDERSLEVDRPLECDLQDLAPGNRTSARASERQRLAGLGREHLDTGRRELAKRIGRAGREAERPVVAGDAAHDSEQLETRRRPPAAPS